MVEQDKKLLPMLIQIVENSTSTEYTCIVYNCVHYVYPCNYTIFTIKLTLLKFFLPVSAEGKDKPEVDRKHSVESQSKSQ